VAGALERVHAAELDSVAGQLAAHYEQAGLSAEAAAFHLRAARRARAVYANTLAIHHYRRGLLLLADAQAADAVELGDELGDLLHFIGRYEEAREVWQRALGCVPAGSAVVRAHIQRKLGNAWRDQYL